MTLLRSLLVSLLTAGALVAPEAAGAQPFLGAPT